MLQANIFYPLCTLKENIFDFIEVTHKMIIKKTSEQLKLTTTRKLSAYNLELLEKRYMNGVVSFKLSEKKVTMGHVEHH